MNSAVMFSKASDEWSTPQDLFDALHAAFNFGLDAAATYENAKCSRFLSDALGSSWRDLTSVDRAIWLNPPYSQCREFIAKAAAEAKKGCTVVCLVPSRTDTRWWHEYVWDREKHQPREGVEIRFIKGRLKFGGATAGAPFPSVVIVFRPPTAHTS
jgi:phage N-6-adenine-methyltransferase